MLSYFHTWAPRILLGLFVAPAVASGASIAWDSITSTTTEGTPTTDPNNGYLYENDVTVVTSFTAGAGTYSPLINYPLVDFTFKANPVQTRVWYERNDIPSNGNPTGYTGNALVDLHDMFDTPLRINYGSDDTFVKTLDSIRFSDTTGVEIAGAAALTGAGVSLIERGANDTNFEVRLITSVDGSGNALTFSPTVHVTSSDPFGSGVANMHHALWDSATTNGIGPFDEPDDLDRFQDIGGLLLTFDEFGLSVGDRVFGYEVAAPATGGRPGLDLLPSGAAFQLDTLPPGALVVVPSPEPESGVVVLGILFGLSAIWYRQRPRKATSVS